MTRITAAARHRLGHRGASLLILGVFDLLYAAYIHQSGGTPTWRWMATVAPLDTWAAAWATAGIVLIGGSLRRRDEWAFGVAVAIKYMWALVFLIGAAVYGVPRAWGSVLIWSLLATWVLIIATWPERQWPDP